MARSPRAAHGLRLARCLRRRARDRRVRPIVSSPRRARRLEASGVRPRSFRGRSAGRDRLYWSWFRRRAAVAGDRYRALQLGHLERRCSLPDRSGSAPARGREPLRSRRALAGRRCCAPLARRLRRVVEDSTDSVASRRVQRRFRVTLLHRAGRKRVPSPTQPRAEQLAAERSCRRALTAWLRAFGERG
jgi:hypothetical protein